MWKKQMSGALVIGVVLNFIFLQADPKPSMSKTITKPAINKKLSSIDQAALNIQEAVLYLDENVQFMANAESSSEDIRQLAMNICKTEAFCILTLAGKESYITWSNKNPLASWDAYYDGTERFHKETAVIFGDTSFHKTQNERLMYVLRGAIHENIFSMIHAVNQGRMAGNSILLMEEFKYGGHPYQDIKLDAVIDLYEELSKKTFASIDRKYQQWQIVFYRSCHFVLRELALEAAQVARTRRNDDRYHDLKDISDSCTLKLSDLKKSLKTK